MQCVIVMQHALATETAAPRGAFIEPNGREYLITTPDGAVFVALTLAEAEAFLSLWRLRSGAGQDRTEAVR